MILKILSWNVWVDGYFNQISEFLMMANADIIGLQEVKANDPTRNFIEYLSKLGYHFVFTPAQKSWRKEEDYKFGPAIFSKYPILRTKTYVLSEINNYVMIGADIQIEDKILHVFSTQLLHTHQKESEEQVEQVANIIKVLPRDKVIVMGDFNATPDSQAIKNMKKLLVDTDSTNTPTWSVYPEGCHLCLPQKIDIRLDYIFTSKDITVKSFKAEDSRGSDHLPILATILV